MQEIWKDISDYKGYYQVSNFGNVKSMERIVERKNNGTGNLPLKSRILSPTTYPKGYKKVTLRKNNISKSFFIHRLVAEAFIPNPNNYPYVNHKDENPSNNHSDNLEWCTNEYNMSYGTLGHRISLAKSKQVFQFDLSGNLLNVFYGVNEASRITNISSSSITNCCNETSKSAGGFLWSFSQKMKLPKYKQIKIIKKYDKNYILIKTYQSMREAEKEEKICAQTFNKYANKGVMYKGFYWELI